MLGHDEADGLTDVLPGEHGLSQAVDLAFLTERGGDLGGEHLDCPHRPGLDVLGGGAVDVETSDRLLGVEIELGRNLGLQAALDCWGGVARPSGVLGDAWCLYYGFAAQSVDAGTFAQSVLEVVEFVYQVAGGSQRLHAAVGMSDRDTDVLEVGQGVGEVL